MAGRGAEQRPAHTTIVAQQRHIIDIVVPLGADVRVNMRTAVPSTYTVDQSIITEDQARKEAFFINYPDALKDYVNSSLVNISEHRESGTDEELGSVVIVRDKRDTVETMLRDARDTGVLFSEAYRLGETTFKGMVGVGREVHVGELNPHVEAKKIEILTLTADIWEIPKEERSPMTHWWPNA